MIGLALTFFAGCARLQPLIQDFNIISIDQEIELSENLAQNIAREMTLINEGAEIRAIKSMGDELVRGLPAKQFNYEFFLVEDNTPNAFTIPGGKIYVHTGLMKFAEPNELAGVLAHEIGHAYERHPTKSVSRAYGLQFISTLLTRQNAASANFKMIALQLAGGSLLTKYGRDDEREADQLSYYLLRRTGRPTDGLLTFLEKLQKLEAGSQQLPTFLRSHPPTDERIQRLENLIEMKPAITVMDGARS